MRVIRNLPPAPEPTRPAYKKPEVINPGPEAKIIKLPCLYNPRPAPLPKGNARNTSTRRSKEWTDEMTDKMIDLFREGLAYSDIADRMGCSTKTIYVNINKARRTGKLKEYRVNIGWSEDQDKTLIEMYEQGSIYADISLAVGKSLPSTAMRIQKLADKGIIKRRTDRRCKK